MSKRPKQERIEQTADDGYWQYHTSGAKFEERLSRAQRAVGAHRAADASAARAKSHRDELKRH